MVGGLRAGMGLAGCRTIEELRTQARFIRITTAVSRSPTSTTSPSPRSPQLPGGLGRRGAPGIGLPSAMLYFELDLPGRTVSFPFGDGGRAINVGAHPTMTSSSLPRGLAVPFHPRPQRGAWLLRDLESRNGTR